MMACSLHLSIFHPSPSFTLVFDSGAYVSSHSLCLSLACRGGNHLFCLTWWENPHIIHQIDDPAFSDEPVKLCLISASIMPDVLCCFIAITALVIYLILSLVLEVEWGHVSSFTGISGERFGCSPTAAMTSIRGGIFFFFSVQHWWCQQFHQRH